MQSEIEDQLDWMKEKNINVNPKDVYLLRKLISKFQEIMIIFKQRIIYQEAKHYPSNSNYRLISDLISPDEKLVQRMRAPNKATQHGLDIIAEYIWRDYTPVHMEEIKKLIIDHGYQLTNLKFDSDSPQPVLVWKYIFRTIDFLFNHQFLDHDYIRKLFAEEKLVDQIIFYTSGRFENEIKVNIWENFLSLTEHWYWAQLNDCFKDDSLSLHKMCSTLSIMSQNFTDYFLFFSSKQQHLIKREKISSIPFLNTKG
jgi:hypothetical protein